MIAVKNLSYTYMTGTPFEKVALKNISFDVADGEVLAIAGHTGSGKSTLIQLVAGLIELTAALLKLTACPCRTGRFGARSASSSNTPNISCSRRLLSATLPSDRATSA